MCFQTGSRESQSNRRQLSFPEIVRIFNSFVEVPHLYLGGGEPFLRKDLCEIISYFMSRNIKICTTTNGTVLNDRIMDFLNGANNSMAVIFSIDGPEEVHDRLRRSKGAFRKVTQALRRMSSLHSVSVNSVVNEESLPHLAELVKELSQYRKGLTFSFQVESWYSKEEVKASEEMLSEWFGEAIKCNVNTRHNGRFDYTSVELEGQIERGKNEARRLGSSVSVVPQIFDGRSDAYLSGTIAEQTSLLCEDMSIAPCCKIDPYGNVFACCQIDKTFGNLLDHPLDDIWRSDQFMMFRQRLAEHNLLPICKRCCKITTFPDGPFAIPAFLKSIA